MGRDIELECPRCRVVAAKTRQIRCPDCGAKLVAAHSPTEAWIRAYLYEGDRSRRVPPRATVEL